MNKNFKFITGVLSLVLCFAAMAFGQKNSGNIEGTVTDPNGAVVAGATVTAKATGKVYTFKPLGDVRPVVDAGGLFNYARLTGMIPNRA